jgi:hypothetical protein
VNYTDIHNIHMLPHHRIPCPRVEEAGVAVSRSHTILDQSAVITSSKPHGYLLEERFLLIDGSKENRIALGKQDRPTERALREGITGFGGLIPLLCKLTKFEFRYEKTEIKRMVNTAVP